MISKSSILTLLFTCLVYPQMPETGSFYYTLSPREAKVGQSVIFQVFEFNLCLYSYDVTYELLPSWISSKKTSIINIVAKRRPECATAAGYSGPLVVFENLEARAYLLQFDSTSDFKRDLGDTNYFEVTSPSMSISKNKSPANPGKKMKSMGKRRIDGREVKQGASAPRKAATLSSSLMTIRRQEHLAG